MFAADSIAKSYVVCFWISSNFGQSYDLFSLLFRDHYKLELNLKFEPGAKGTEPFLLNDSMEPETIEVDSSVFFVVNMKISIEINEKLMEYIKPKDGHYFDFYTCDVK